MSPERMDLERALSRMPPNAKERCLYVDHAWTNWGPWIPIYRALSPVSWKPAHPSPEPTPVEAYRDRGCPRCGTVQRELYDGERRIIDDPTGIEARIKRPAQQ